MPIYDCLMGITILRFSPNSPAIYNIAQENLLQTCFISLNSDFLPLHKLVIITVNTELFDSGTIPICV